MAKKWCSDFKKISELLKANGIELKKDMIKEPEKVDIRYERVEKNIKTLKNINKISNNL